MSLFTTLGYILHHPLNRESKPAALAGFLRWQIGSRLLPGAAVLPFVNDTCLVVSPGMTGATLNVYTGLADFADCSLLLHLLRAGELFVDIGANVGVYSVLAAGACGARVVAIEPVPSTYTRLLANIRANNIQQSVAAHNIGLGRASEMLRFTADRDTQNHIITDPQWRGASIDVPVRRLDDVLGDDAPTLIKIDVEGWESEVLAGAEATLRRPSLLALIVEMNSSSAELSPNESAVHACLLRHGFAPCSYAPFTRALEPLAGKNRNSPNTIYLRNIDEVKRRIQHAPAYRVRGRAI